jgi:hypothetical protein
MKPLILTLLTALPIFVFSQVFNENLYSDFANPSDEEIRMKTCSFDPEAAAVILRKDATVAPDEPRMFSYFRYRIKILKKSGLEHANIRIRFRHVNEFEQISNIRAVSINYDENGNKKISAVNAKNIYPKKEDEYYSSISFTMPEVNEGTIIEYSYVSERKAYYSVDYWYFQDELPVLSSIFDYTVLPNSNFTYRVLKSPLYPIKFNEVKNQGRLIFEMNRMPGVTDEPFMDSKRDYLSRVELQMNSLGYGIDRDRFVGSWPELTQQLLKDDEFGGAISGNIKAAEGIVQQAKRISSLKDRVAFVYAHVQKQLMWNHYIGIYAKESLRSVWDKRRGSSAEINLTLINLLNESGVNASPLLVSDRSHGKVDVSHPFIGQFSKVIAYVPSEGGAFFLDATEVNSNPSLIPENFLNTTGYLVDKKRSGFVEISDNTHRYQRTVNITAKVDNGEVKGQVFVSDKDYARVNRDLQIKADQNGYIAKNFIQPYNKLNVDSFKTDNIDIDSLPLNVKFEFSQKLEESGDYHILYTNLFSGLEKNPFVSNSRHTEINFGTKNTVTFNQMYELAPDVSLESFPKSISLRTSDSGMVISRIVEPNADGKKVLMRTKVELNRTVYSAEEYKAVKEFFRKMFDILNEPFVVKRKA